MNCIETYGLTEAHLKGLQYYLNTDVTMCRTEEYNNHDIDINSHALEVQKHVFEDYVELKASTPALYNSQFVKKEGPFWKKKKVHYFSIRYEHPETVLIFRENDNKEFEFWQAPGEVVSDKNAFKVIEGVRILLMIYVRDFKDERHRYPTHNIQQGYYPE